jgi:hypothetical protein
LVFIVAHRCCVDARKGGGESVSVKTGTTSTLKEKRGGWGREIENRNQSFNYLPQTNMEIQKSWSQPSSMKVDLMFGLTAAVLATRSLRAH